MRLAAILDDIANEMASIDERGQPATYIRPLSTADTTSFGIAVVTPDGQCHTAGDADTGFSIQSISKLFSFAIALGAVGDQLWQRVGREPSGNAFNSIVQLEAEGGKPRNPFINAGAIVVADVLLGGHRPRETIGDILRFIRFCASDERIVINKEIALCEQAHGDRNKSLAHFMRAAGNLHQDPDLVLGTYFHACAIEMSCRQLAAAGRFLMLDGRHPDGGRVVPASRARRILSLMMTCGQYDASGDFAFRVGIPAKSGVGGGILAIAPGCASIAVWCPGLDASGNSLIGTLALERLAEATGWNVFAARERGRRSPDRRPSA